MSAMTCLFCFFRFTKSQQFNINLLKNKEGVYVWCRTRDCPAGDLPGARLGGIGIGFAGGLGVLVLTLLFQIKPGAIPFDVIEIIMAVIAAIAAMQVAGGMDYLVSLAERMLRRHPKYITFLAPLVTWFMTVLAGTGHTAFSTLPVITEVAKEQGIRPSRPLSIAVVASQIAITASPISAAVVFLPGSSNRWA
jgi:anaerobic C4-dicarboxylate transporter DcuA